MMSDFEVFLEPVSLERFSGGREYQQSQLGKVLRIHSEEHGFPDLEGVHMAIVGVMDDRRSLGNEGCALAPDATREYLYRLFPGDWGTNIADLGNLRQGHRPDDTTFALAAVMTDLLKLDIIPIVIGGGQELTYAQYLAYKPLERTVNIVSIDPLFDLGAPDAELHSQSWLSKIILQQPNYLFNYSNIGYQTYFVEQASVDLMTRLNFDVHRLGVAREDIEKMEPVIRNADLISFDMSAVRRSEAPGCGNASPNGFFADEICRLARYAGISDKLSTVGFYEMNPAHDAGGHTAQLLAQVIWCFADGYYSRKNDFPFTDFSSYTKYRVFLKDHKHEIVFYKSSRSDRWWMEVPYPPDKRLRFERHHLVPCTYNDYEEACKEEMPDRWWQTFQKLS
ncbi:MAG: arginase family hydrolase [Bacteroidetes bacterium]|nr:MAG: arginase family hydrolase [Bacteroidota bacterium]